MSIRTALHRVLTVYSRGIAVSVGIGVGSMIMNNGCLPWDDRVDHALAGFCPKFNESLPQMMDADTGADLVEAIPHRTMRFKCTMVNVTRPNDYKPEGYIDAARIVMLAQYKADANLKEMRDHKVTLRHEYADKDGLPLGEVIFGPADLH